MTSPCRRMLGGLLPALRGKGGLSDAGPRFSPARGLVYLGRSSQIRLYSQGVLGAPVSRHGVFRKAILRERELAGRRDRGGLAALKGMGMEGYLAMARTTMEAANRLRAGIASIGGLEIVGSPTGSVFSCRGVEITSVVFWGFVADRFGRRDLLAGLDPPRAPGLHRREHERGDGRRPCGQTLRRGGEAGPRCPSSCSSPSSWPSASSSCKHHEGNRLGRPPPRGADRGLRNRPRRRFHPLAQRRRLRLWPSFVFRLLSLLRPRRRAHAGHPGQEGGMIGTLSAA